MCLTRYTYVVTAGVSNTYDTCGIKSNLKLQRYVLPGDVPRHITPHFGAEDVVYISFQFDHRQRQSRSPPAAFSTASSFNAARQESCTTESSAKATGDLKAGENSATTTKRSSVWRGELRGSRRSKRVILRPHPGMIKQVYTITSSASTSSTADTQDRGGSGSTSSTIATLATRAAAGADVHVDGDCARSRARGRGRVHVSLYDVEDFESYSTPVLIMKTASAGGETSNLLVELATSDAHFLYDKSKTPHKEPAEKERAKDHAAEAAPAMDDHIFQSDPKRINALYDDHESDEAGAGLRILRRVLHQAVEAYLNTTLDCTHVDGPSTAQTQCEDLINDALMQGMQRAAATPPHAQVYESWVNVAKKGQVAAYQRAHNHLATHTQAALTAVYYASTGAGSSTAKREATTLILGRPSQTITLQRKASDWWRIDAEPGDLVIFPVYLKHVGDVHRGHGDRISIASNIAI